MGSGRVSLGSVLSAGRGERVRRRAEGDEAGAGGDEEGQHDDGADADAQGRGVREEADHDRAEQQAAVAHRADLGDGRGGRSGAAVPASEIVVGTTVQTTSPVTKNPAIATAGVGASTTTVIPAAVPRPAPVSRRRVPTRIRTRSPTSRPSSIASSNTG